MKTYNNPRKEFMEIVNEKESEETDTDEAACDKIDVAVDYAGKLNTNQRIIIEPEEKVYAHIKILILDF